MKDIRTLDAIQRSEVILLFLSICGYGLFYDGIAGVAGAALMVLLLLRLREKRTLVLPKSLLLLGLGSLPVAALVTAPYAIDSGMALMGFVKFLPLPMFILLMSMEGQEIREKFLDLIPMMASVVTTIGLASYWLPIRDYFFINDRFSGVFQYANGYALFLLVSLLILLWSPYRKKWSILMTVILVGGIIATGCRAVFFLMVASVLVWLWIMVRGKSKGAKDISYVPKRRLLVAILSMIGLSLILEIATGNLSIFARFMQISTKSSSLIGRLIYNLDGLQMLEEHPLGLGYKGYLFYQGSVQTGNYTVTFAHNELLQAALDFGIVMGLLLGVGYILTLLRRGMPIRNRVILTVIGIHGLFDWCLQFDIILLIVVLLTEDDCAIKIPLQGIKYAIFRVGSALVLIAACWLSLAGILEFTNAYETAAKVYPGLTTSQMRVINCDAADDVRYAAAEKICSRNENCTIALQAMAEKSAREGDYAKMAQYGEKAMLSSRYNKGGYEIYLYLLSHAVEICSNQGDQAQAYRYLTEAASVAERIKTVENETSPYAKYLYDKPEIQLDEQYITYMSQAEALVKERK